MFKDFKSNLAFIIHCREDKAELYSEFLDSSYEFDTDEESSDEDENGEWDEYFRN